MYLSIITINYNNIVGLRRTIDSVMSQTWRDFEWIIVDGGSTDGSRELIEQIAANPNSNISWWCSEPDKGVYNAMNKGIKKADGEYLNFMNSGDCFHDTTTLQQVFDGKEYDVDVLYGETLYHYPNKVVHRHYPDSASLNYFIFNNHINHQSLFIKRLLQIDNMYDENNKISSDYLFLLHCQFENKVFKSLNGIIVCDYDATGISQTDSFNAWREAHCGLEKELMNRFFMDDIRSVYNFINKRRFNKSIVALLIKILS